VVSVCHPDWRGVRTSAYSHRAPVVEVADAGHWSEALAGHLEASGIEVLVVHGFPLGSEHLIRRAAARGLSTRCVLYSSMAQYGGDAIEAGVFGTAVELLREGSMHRLGIAKGEHAEALAALGIPASFVPNRAPQLPPFSRLQLDGGRLHVGIFAEPFWRKNLVTQLGAVALLDNAVAHLIHRPDLPYLDGVPMVEHRLMPYEEFIRLQSSVDLNLYVTLSECQPLTPIESYLAGVPCLSSRTSLLFRDDPDLWQLTTVDELDNPLAIARAAQRLLERKDEAVDRARVWIERWDTAAAERWRQFVAP
jgi:hypothetical protein